MTYPNYPDEHTLNADKLRQAHYAIELLKHERDCGVCTDKMGHTIDSLVAAWGPVQAEMMRQTLQYRDGGYNELAELDGHIGCSGAEEASGG